MERVVVSAVNLDTPAGEAMRSAVRTALDLGYGPDPWNNIGAAEVLSAALSATVECAACGGRGTIPDPLAGYGGRIVTECPRCRGTGRRLAIKEMLDE